MEEARSEIPVPAVPGPDFRAAIRTVRRRWPVGAVLAVAVVGGTAAWTYRQPKIYEATCAIVIETMAPQVLQGVKEAVELGTGSMWATREFYETQFRIMRSTEVMQRVIERLRLQHDKDFVGSGNADVRAVAQNASGTIRIGNVKDSRVVNIQVEDRSAERAALIANTLADVYIEHNLDFRLSGAKSATVWLTEQESELRKKVEASDLALYDFRKDKNLLDVGLDAKQTMTSQNLQALNQKLSELTIKHVELESTRKLIVAARQDPEEKESLPQIRENPTLGTLRADFIALRKKLADLSPTYLDKHPEVRRVEEQMISVRRDYEQEVDRILKAFDKSYQALVDTEKSLTRKMEQEKQAAIELSKVEVEYKPLQRSAENNGRVYGMVTQRQKEVDLTGMMRSNNVRILDRATVSPSPVRPKVLLNLGLSLAIGLVVGMGLIFALDALDLRLKTQEDTERLLGAAVLGIIPTLDRLPRPKEGDDESLDLIRSRDLSVFRNPKSAAAECCRSLRTNLLFLSPDRPLRSFVVSSPGPKEGKTTTVVNLGATLAVAGSKVLLVDTDMRRPRLHRSFGVSNEVGMSTVILGEARLSDVIKHTEVPNLDVIPCGPTPPNPAELLHTDRFAKVLAELASGYDKIILDSPPTSAVTDPAILGNLTDGVLLVVRAARTRRDAALHARRHLAAAKAKLLGVIINEIDASQPGDYYGYYYARGSYYGAYYGADDKAKAKA